MSPNPLAIKPSSYQTHSISTRPKHQRQIGIPPSPHPSRRDILRLINKAKLQHQLHSPSHRRLQGGRNPGMRVRRVFPDENNLTPSASCSEKRTVRRYIILGLKVRRDIQLVLSYDRRRPARSHVFVQQPALAIVPATESPSARGRHMGVGVATYFPVYCSSATGPWISIMASRTYCTCSSSVMAAKRVAGSPLL